ncbi:MAG TPA: FmdB family zinc ribbon protein [Thermoanaerobaculia bacterium]|nr:FmdB family zinc ribbon protein [Thermoanaerobaculia bacterium]
MPLYEYECLKCGKRTELLQRFEDAPLAACPKCGGEVKKLFSAPAVQFKGSGWYVTDYKKGGGGSSSKPESKGDGGGEKADKADKGEKADKADKPAESAKPAESKPSSGGSE